MDELQLERARNREDIIKHAKWQAEMVKKLGVKWFEQRDRWLRKRHEASRKMWENPKVREALLRALRAHR